MEDVSTLFNSLPHIDTFKTGLTPHEKHKSDVFTFLLPHKHFELGKSEVLFATRVSDGYDVTVKSIDSLEDNAKPCMWLHSVQSDKWVPFCFADAEHGFAGDPDVPFDDYCIGMRWLNDGGLERTDESLRYQQIRPDDASGNKICTMINWVCLDECRRAHCHAYCRTTCQRSACWRTPANRHTRRHTTYEHKEDHTRRR